MARTDRGPGLQAPGRPERTDRYTRVAKVSKSGEIFVDYKDSEQLRRMMSSNGKMSSRRRNGATAMEQRMISQAIKRARFMALLPFVESSA